MTNPIMKFFHFGHLPDTPKGTFEEATSPRQISAECANLAAIVDQGLIDSAEKSAGLRKLLEAKDCFVRAALPDPDVFD